MSGTVKGVKSDHVKKYQHLRKASSPLSSFFLIALFSVCCLSKEDGMLHGIINFI
jgi:hypothetical protein